MDILEPEIVFEDEIEVEVGEPPVDEPIEDPNKLMEEKLAEMQANNDKLQNQLQMLQNLKVEMPQIQPQEPARPQVQPEQFNEKDFNENFYTDPLKYLTKFNQQKLTPELSSIIASTAMMGKKFLEVDSETKDNYKKYKSEVDGEIGKLNPLMVIKNPNAVRDVYDRVMARHVNDLVSERTEALIEERLNAKLKELGIEIGEKKKQGKPDFVNEQTQPQARTGVVKAYLTKEEAAYADANGIDYQEYYHFLKRKGKK